MVQIYRMIGWDFDGTIENSLPFQIDFNLEMKRRFGAKIDFPEREDVNGWKKLSRANLRDFLSYAGFPEESKEDIVRLYKEEFSPNFYKTPHFYEGIRELVLSVRRLGLPQFILSHNSKDNILPTVKDFIKDDIKFMYVIHGEKLEEEYGGKKSLALAHMKKRAGKTDVVYVGDTEYDYLSSFEAGVGFEGVNWGYGFNGSKEKVSISNSVLELENKLLG